MKLKELLEVTHPQQHVCVRGGSMSLEFDDINALFAEREYLLDKNVLKIYVQVYDNIRACDDRSHLRTVLEVIV